MFKMSLTDGKYHYMFYQDTMMICLNPVTNHDDSVKRGLFATDTDLLSKSKDKTFKEILLTDAYGGRRSCSGKIFWGSETMGPIIGSVVQKKQRSQRLQAILRTIISFQIIKYSGHVWFSFFEGMHRHAAIVSGLVCSKFDHTTNELKPGSLTFGRFQK